MSALARSKKQKKIKIKKFVSQDELDGVCDFIRDNIQYP